MKDDVKAKEGDIKGRGARGVQGSGNVAGFFSRQRKNG
jgi:hypothetical protein